MYTLDKFHVQESDKVLRLYLVYCLNGKMALINLLIIFRFWYCLACSESARGKGVVTPSLKISRCTNTRNLHQMYISTCISLIKDVNLSSFQMGSFLVCILHTGL